jgi:type II secretory pathway pseudopilin PulG
MEKRGQIWVETVIYTLIAFALMGLVLAFVVPKVKEIQSKGIIDQSIGVLQDIDSLIRGLGGPGNQRVLELGIQEGSITIDPTNEKIFFNLESNYQYSEPGKSISVGGIDVFTETKGKLNLVTLTLNYSGEYNINYQGGEEIKTLSKAPVPYRISISDQGQDASGKIIINIEVTE